jgi:signal transduction histidine kinase
LLLAAELSNRRRWLDPRVMIALLIVPAVTQVLIWTNGLHGLIWATVALDTAGPFPALQVTYGPWFWVVWVSAQIQLLLGTIFLFVRLVRLRKLYRWQVGLLILAALAPWIGNITYVLRLLPIPNLDLTPFAFGVAALIVAYSIFRYRFLDLRPVARKAVVDGLPDAVLVFDLMGRVAELNPAAEALLRLPPDPFGKADEAVLTYCPELLPIARQQGSHQEVVHLNGAGRDPLWLNVTASDLMDGPDRAGRLLVIQNITARKQIELSLAAARDQAIEASQLKSQILAKVSHELRTPLGAILGYAELMQTGTYGLVSERQTAVTDRIIHSAHYLTRLVNELLDQAQLDTGRLRLQAKPTDLRQLLEGVRQQLETQAQAKGLVLTFEIDPALPVTMVIDGRRVAQIVINLGSNAIKFTETGRVHISARLSGTDTWTICAADTGIGIAPEHKAHIFEPFWQADSGLTRESGGYGLGLAIVRQLVDLMHGTVTVDSTPGVGSTFTVTLPLRTIL